MSRLQKDHLAAIVAVLAAVPADMPVAHVSIVFQDAFVACMMGLSCGLTLEQIQRNVEEVLTYGDDEVQSVDPTVN